MSNFKLTLPTDIPWKRICVTQDMVDRRACDERLPAKWQTSIAVFKYTPDEENQLYPDYNISYLKVTATITGYQPLNKEVQGSIEWGGLNVETIPGLTDLLTSYNPCHGAILQVVVAPEARSGIRDLDKYPFFLDFEPKKRELYEIATDTKEKQSRSLESLNLTKSSGTVQSTEILDVDMGGGGGGGNVSVFGTGGGFSYSAPNGQWGTKQLNSAEGIASRSTDLSTEKRETYSFSTQISQMYHLMDSYHLGTNRAVFFVQPRPHTLEEPSGFVRGPRPVEGIQEFFLVVAQPKDQDDYCISVRLDTGHLTKTPIMDYERRSQSTTIATATARVATRKDIPDGTIVGARACAVFDCWDVHYHCFRTEATDSVTFDAPAGFRIVDYDILINEATHGSTSVVVTPNGKSLNINVEARGHKCFEGNEVCFDCPDEIQAYAGQARCQVQVNMISETPIVQVGEEEVLMITTRGLCCCETEPQRKPMREQVVGVRAIPSEFAMNTVAAGGAAASRPVKERAPHGVEGAARLMAASPGSRDRQHGHACAACAGTARESSGEVPTIATDVAADRASELAEARQRIRQANALSGFIKTEAIRSLNDPTAKPQDFVETEFFAKQLEARLARTRRGQKTLAEPLGAGMLHKAAPILAEHLNKSVEELKVRDLFAVRSSDLKRAGVDPAMLQAERLKALGVVMRPHENSESGNGEDASTRD